MSSMNEKLIIALLNGEVADFTPTSRTEEYLKRCIEGGGVEGLPAPVSRQDALLYSLCEKLSNPSNDIDFTLADATEGDVAKGKTFYAQDDTLKTGTLDLGDNEPWVKTAIRVRNGNGMALFSGFTGDTVEDLISFGDTSEATSLQSLFNNNSNISTVPLLDTSSASNIIYMFNGCTNLSAVPLFDTSNATEMKSMFQSCRSITIVPLFNTSKVTTMDSMLRDCRKLSSVPLFDTSNVTIMTGMFLDCHNLKTIPLFNTSKVTKMDSMFYGCKSLEVIPALDMIKVTNAGSMVQACTSLTEIWIKNIKTALTIGWQTTYGHLVTVESLIHLVRELIDTGSSKKLTVGSANLTKLSTVYVKLVTDDGSGKLPFEVCESTDEEAMLISDYVQLKNWALA